MRSEIEKRENRFAIRAQDTRGGRREGRALYFRSVTRGARIPRSFVDSARSVPFELPAKGESIVRCLSHSASLTCLRHARREGGENAMARGRTTRGARIDSFREKNPSDRVSRAT